ncbi:MAG TPA: lysophospholipid acyltransferase family protein [Povalibacter sp.]|nr:lysophospholipid acyltransferase family protein [Povalibacter sp.]
MTQPKRSRSSRKLTPGRVFVYRIAVGLASLVLEVLWWTCRIRYVGLEEFRELVRKHGAVVPVCWHQHLLLIARFLVSSKVRPMKPGFMISPSVDGEAPSMLARFYGAQVVRGSGTYSGLRAVRGAHSSLQEGISLAVTPDGPRGPRFKFKPGAIFAAQISGKPVVPVAYAARPARILKTWDKFVIPLPFGRVHIAMGEPYYPPKELNGEQMAEVQRELERRMLETYTRAKQSLES